MPKVTLALRSKLLISFIACGVAPLLALFAYLQVTVISEMREKSLMPLASMTGPLQESVDRGLGERFGDAMAFAAAAASDLDEGDAMDRVTRSMNRRMVFYPVYKAMVLADPSGRIIAANTRDAAGRGTQGASLVGRDIGGGEWFRRAASGGGEDWKTMSGASIGAVEKSPIVAAAAGDDGFSIPFAAPVKDASGRVIAVWVNYLNPTFVDELVLGTAHRLGEQLGQDVEVTVFDHAQRVVTAYDQDVHSKTYTRDPGQFENVTVLLKDVQMTGANGALHLVHDGNDVGAAYAISDGDNGEPTTGWRTIVVASDEALLAESREVSESIIIFIVLAIAVATAAGWWLGRGISAPITALIVRMRQLVAGDKTTEVPSLERADDIGDIARAVEVFREAAVEKDRVEAEVEAERQRATAERERVAARQKLAVDRLGEALGALAEGDLSHTLPADFPEEYDRLKQDHSAAIGRLRDTMQAIIQSAEAIRTGTVEIAGASEDLARRTEAQAASLEETAAALEETSGAVKANASSSREAAAKVGVAREAAAEGRTAAQETIDAIARIQSSQREIGSIVGVMQEIAYQTNILALNAGVEAARAGDAGRGFMVVANEVRLLAQRSSEAAKDIQRLIGGSNEQVDDGVALVNKSAEMLQRIVDDVMSVNELIGDIAAASERQALGVNQISSAVNQMDSTTQQNAAMVEQTTAAARSLASETESLSNMIGFFRIGRGGGGSSFAAPARESYEPAPSRAASAQRPPLRLAVGSDVGAAASNDDWSKF
ncbi:MAG: methyl-accepting chemotaxis protein [Alphaproteobacteria bacterium]|nr:methyl-accepting chemotaxis protein [Alphaproteobacteria bacterium]